MNVLYESSLTDPWWCLFSGWTSACQWPTHSSQRGVIAWDDQPGRHGNTAQIHVCWGQQARDDSAHCGPAGVQKERGSPSVVLLGTSGITRIGLHIVISIAITLKSRLEHFTKNSKKYMYVLDIMHILFTQTNMVQSCLCATGRLIEWNRGIATFKLLRMISESGFPLPLALIYPHRFFFVALR